MIGFSVAPVQVPEPGRSYEGEAAYCPGRHRAGPADRPAGLADEVDAGLASGQLIEVQLLCGPTYMAGTYLPKHQELTWLSR